MTDRDTGTLSPEDEKAAKEFLASFGEFPEPAPFGRNMYLRVTKPITVIDNSITGVAPAEQISTNTNPGHLPTEK